MVQVSDPSWNVIKQDFVSVPLGSCFVYCCYRYLPIPTPVVTHLSDHLLYALKWQLPSVMAIYWAMAKVITKRLEFSAHDPLKQLDNKAAADTLEVHRRFLTNTIEQYVINGPALLMLSLYLTPHQLKIIPLLVDLFVFGRITFLYGYLDPAKERSSRSFGFVMTFLPTGLVLGYVALCFCSDFLSALL